jgi:hypothetical protein
MEPEAGVAYLPLTAAFIMAAGVSPLILARVGTIISGVVGEHLLNAAAGRRAEDVCRPVEVEKRPAGDGPLEKVEASRIPRSREETTILWSLVR